MAHTENRRLMELFHAAVDLGPAEQAEFLARLGADRDPLRDRLEALLVQDRKPLDYRLQVADALRTQPDESASADEPARARPVAIDAVPPGASVEMAAFPQPTGRIRQYELIRELGRGGMGAVYLARDIKLGRRVAIKFLLGRDRRLTKRFIVEARTTAQCIHENIVTIHDVDEHAGNPFMVLEYIEGKSLRELLDGRPLAARRAIDIAIPVLSALARAHEMGIVHRDLKPENVMLTASGTVKVLDFGIAKLLADGQLVDRPPRSIDRGNDAAPGLAGSVTGRLAGTGTGVLIGTPPYMSPEQMLGATVDHRTDIWAMGVMLCEMVTGRHPLAPLSRSKLAEVADLHRPMPRVADIAPELGELGAIVDRCLIKDKQQRIATARDLLAEFQALVRPARDGLARDRSPFAGAHDRSPVFRLPHKLYGRSDQRKRLVHAFDAATGGQTSVLTITGPAGIGKSSLVDEFLRPMTESRGHYAVGKFDQYRKDTPYSAVVRAIRGLLRQILSQGDLRRWRSRFSAILGENARVLTDVLPELGVILDVETGEVPALGSREAQNRFIFHFQRFLRVLATKDHPLVLFVDDLQWADAASLELISNILHDPTSEYLLFLGAYRDEEVGREHPLVGALARVEAVRPIRTVALAQLRSEDICDLLADTLRRPLEDVRELASVLERKTRGNPFFIRQFLQAIHSQSMLEYDPEQGFWSYDVARIRDAGFSDDVIELMTREIDQLDGGYQDLLGLASCLGTEFDAAVIASLTERSEDAIAQQLIPVIRLGMVDAVVTEKDPHEVSRHRYRFAHDKVRQALYVRLAPEERAQCHLRAGLLLLARADEVATDAQAMEASDALFDIVDHLNSAAHLIDDPALSERLIRLNVAAARRAKASAAFPYALQYIVAAMDQLPDDPWEVAYDLTRSIYLERGEAEFLCYDHDASDRYLGEVIARARSTVDKVPAYAMRIVSFATQGQWLRAIGAGREVLAILGVDFPTDEAAGKAQTEAQRALLDSLLERTSIEELEHLPTLEDPTQAATVQILVLMLASVYIGAPHLLPLAVFSLVNIAIQHGNVGASAISYAYLAVLLSPGVFEDIDRSRRFADLSYRIAEKYGVARLFGTMLDNIHGAFVVSWTRPIHESLPFFRRSYELGAETGSFEYGGLSIHSYCMQTLFQWRDLDEAIEQWSAHEARLANLQQPHSARWFYLWWQFANNLQGRCEDPLELSGDKFDEHDVLPIWDRFADRTGQGFFHVAKLMLAYVLGEKDAARAQAERAGEVLIANAGLYTYALYTLFAGLTRVQQAAAGDPGDPATRESPQESIDRARALLGDLQRWAGHCEENFGAMAALLEAEIAAYEDRPFQDVVRIYERAADRSRGQRQRLYEGIACERAAEFCARHGHDRIRRGWLRDAYTAYASLGAGSKLEQLGAAHGDLGGRPHVATASTVSPTTTPVSGTEKTFPDSTGNLDAISVLEASRAISSEIRRDELIASIMQIIARCAGADGGCLLLRQGEWLRVEAELERGSGQVRLGSPGLDEATSVCPGAIRHVDRTRNTVVLGDARIDGPFVADDYVRQTRVRSMLCAPIVAQARSLGVLYLENRAIADAFDEQRVAVVESLLAHAAVSFENARLYEELGNRHDTEARRARGVAHEMRNILGAVTIALTSIAPDPGSGESILEDSMNAMESLLGVLELPDEQRPGALEDAVKTIYTAEQTIASVVELTGMAMRRASVVTDQIVDFSRIDARLSPQMVVVAQVLAEVKRESDERYRSDGVVVVVEDSDDELRVVTDATNLYSMLLNLIHNARDAILEARATGRLDSGTIRVVATSDGREWTLDVHHDGAAIDDEGEQRVFDANYTTKLAGVTSLGLALVSRFVQSVGGSLSVESQPGDTTFSVRMPVRPVALR